MTPGMARYEMHSQLGRANPSAQHAWGTVPSCRVFHTSSATPGAGNATRQVCTSIRVSAAALRAAPGCMLCAAHAVMMLDYTCTTLPSVGHTKHTCTRLVTPADTGRGGRSVQAGRRSQLSPPSPLGGRAAPTLTPHINSKHPLRTPQPPASSPAPPTTRRGALP